MILPTLLVEVWFKSGDDVYAQPIYSHRATEKMAPVKLDFQMRSTSVRTDAAASKARAQEDNANVILLALPTSKVELNDKLIVHGHALRVINAHPRYTVTGKFDHIEIRCMAWD